MAFDELTAISPVDGRYRKKTEKLSEYFSESALIRYRILVEVEYLIALSEIPLPGMKAMSVSGKAKLRSLYTKYSAEDARRIKTIEKTTNHDVKAVEYFLREKVSTSGLSEYREFVHFGLTSQDVNNTAIPFALSKCLDEVVIPMLLSILKMLKGRASKWNRISMLAHTHGQPASPTGLGKEIRVFAERLESQLKSLRSIDIECKLGGATGNFNAHKVTYQKVNWIGFANVFTKKIFGLKRQQTTTQIEQYDTLSALFDAISRINNIFIDLSRDTWLYISMGYFSQNIKKGEVGSSAMPHKVNPIDFENAEGNLGYANAIFSHLSSKLPVSRLQRDLTDSTVLRNIGVPIAHSMVAWQAILSGFDKLEVNRVKIAADLDENWLVISEAIQSILRREGVEGAYDIVKEATRTGKAAGKADMHRLIDKLPVKKQVKEEMKKISPSNYTGYSSSSRG